MQLLQDLQFVVRAQAAARFIDAQFRCHAGDHRRAVAGQQQRAPAPRLARGQQGRRIGAQAIIEDEPGQRPFAVAEQQPLAGFFGHRRHTGATEFADESRLTDAQAPPFNQPLQAKTRCAVDFFGRHRRTTESTGDGVFGAVFQGCGQAQALVAVEGVEGVDRA
ncbi:hypothetical protein D9M71_631310 [compost metagenome]